MGIAGTFILFMLCVFIYVYGCPTWL